MTSGRSWWNWGAALSCATALLAACSGAREHDPAPLDSTPGGGRDDGEPEPDPGPQLLECNEPPLETSALAFGGADRVSMGVAPELGLERFTLETWVRRDGRGSLASTGVGGLKLVPLITKGRGESDGTNLDCNYAFGFYGDVLGADFEDMESGKNHPVYGKTPIRQGEWRHVAATYDGTTWRLYVDGKLDAEREVNAIPRHDSIQHFGLGAAYNSLGVAAGGLHGALDEVRVYSRALTEPEIAGAMYSTKPDASGLVGHWRLDAVDGDVRDALGASPGTVTGASFIAPGPVLDRGVAPSIRSAKSSGPQGGKVTVSVDAADADGDDVEVEFYARALTDKDDFTVVVIPDSQYYTRDAAPPARPQADNPAYFDAQTRWAMDNRASRNVVGLIHVGDIINNADVRAQWQRADRALAILEQPSPDLPDGLPYGLSFGNHDQFPRDVPSATAIANEFFGPQRYRDRAYYGDTYDGTNDENWVSFRAGGLHVIALSLQFRESADPNVLAWARSVFESHPDAFGIVNSHHIVTGGGNFSGYGRQIYEALKDVPNVHLMASGHVSVDARRRDEYQGNVIHSMLSDYQRTTPDPADPSRPLVGDQSRTNGGRGYMRIWRFSPAKRQLFVETYSPMEKGSYTDKNNKFTLDIDLKGSGGKFDLVSRAVAKDGVASVELPAAAPGTTLEWYAVARDCSHKTLSPLAQVVSPSN
ncbi:MAG: metallophosphoesterase [Labilithrix sp.]|nr:metallophosphoesterase [Labilithrix sp.]